MPCRSCPSVLERAITTIDDVRRTTPQLMPVDYDYAQVQAALRDLARSVRDELARQGRLP
jgi:hypothetical protein